MRFNTIIFDLGNTLIRQQIDDVLTLDRLKLKSLRDTSKTLKTLHEYYKIGLLTNTRLSKKYHVKNAIAKLGWTTYIDKIVTSQDVGAEKPSRLIFKNILDNMKISASESIMVGNDLYADIFGAKRLGMTTIFFSCNIKDWEQLDKAIIKPDYVIKEIKNIIPLLKKLEKVHKE
jgi:putative hydrolase of the HAD superfamily